MKKRILFIMDSLRIGGAEKSLVTILNLLDYEKYDIDLYLLNHEGEFYSFIPKQVNILKEDSNYKIFAQGRKKSVIMYLLKFDFKNAFYSLCWLFGALLYRITNKKLYIGWKFIKKIIKPLDKEYDTSIAFLERKTIYFNVNKVKAKNKIGFIHNDYSKHPYNYKLEKKYFKYYNKIATVSESCKCVLENIFPEYKEKFIVIKNIVLKGIIVKLSKEKIDTYDINRDCTNIVSVGRLVYQKGFDIAIEICKKLVDDGIKINWYIIGEGEERHNLEELIKKHNLEKNFILVGRDVNPYKWMNIADIYIQPSRWEGYGITVAEAMKLEKLIITSNIREFKELLKNEKGIIANDTNDFYSKIKENIINREIREKYINNLKTEKDNLDEIKKIIRFLDS